MWKRNVLMIFWVLPLAFSASAQDATLSRAHFPEDLREDLGIIRATMEQAHPDPYRYRSAVELDKLFDTLSGSFTGPLTAEGFIQATLPIFRAIGDAGAMLSPPAAVSAVYEHSEPLIPISVAVIGGRLYLNEELKGFRSLPAGCELLRINDLPADRILAMLRESQVAEGADTTLLDRRIERDFPLFYLRYVERSMSFSIDYRNADGTTGSQDLFALTKDEMRQTYTPRGYDLQPWRMEEVPGHRTAWLTLGTMDTKDLESRRIPPERFLNNVMEALRKSEATNLVIDVRGAGGADPGLAELVFAVIAKEPYRVVKSMSVRSGRVPDYYQYASPAPDFFASVGATYLPELKGRRELKADDPRLLPIMPVSKAFQGRVYVICDGLTTGAGAAFVMLAKRSGRARTVGEETGANAASFCGGQTLDVTLPRTGCVLHVPLVRYVPDGIPGGPVDRGEMPGTQVPQRKEDVPKGKDTVREALLNFIAELQ